MMRITDDSNYRNILQDIQRIAERMQKAQNQVSSGKKLNRPSDDPSAAADVVRIDSEHAANAQYLDNISTAQSRLQFADTALDGVQLAVERIRTLALLAEDSHAAASSSIAEISGLRDQLLSSANSTFDGQFIFGGSKTQTPAYVKESDGSVTYAGNSDAMKLQIGRVATLQTQIPGDEIFSGSVDIFKTVTDLVSALKSDDKSAIQLQVANLGRFSQALSSARSHLGGLINVANSSENELKQIDLAQTAQLSQLQDADLARALSEFSQSQTALQAATAVGARVSSISLLDYLK